MCIPTAVSFRDRRRPPGFTTSFLQHDLNTIFGKAGEAGIGRIAERIGAELKHTLIPLDRPGDVRHLQDGHGGQHGTNTRFIASRLSGPLSKRFTSAREIETMPAKDFGSHALLFAKDSKQQMLDADMPVE